MSNRNYENWITAYMEYAGISEAPDKFHFWTAVSCIAGALRRKVWLDMGRFHWFANFYIVLIARPGWKKSSSVDIGMRLLRKVEDVHFGPDAITWQALVTSMASAREEYFYGNEVMVQSAITIESGELGNLLNPEDREMVDLLVTLWDGRASFAKTTKMSGNDFVENPWLNIIACTTPLWIAGNFPQYLVGGGFTSRCLFVVGTEKKRHVAYPHLHVQKNDKEVRAKLIADLDSISKNIAGPYTLTQEAIEWGEKWYANHEETMEKHPLYDDRFGGYLARKQAHIHKLAMILAASQRNELVVTVGDLQSALAFVEELEADMPAVFAEIGKSEMTRVADRMVELVQRRTAMRATEVFAMLHNYFPDNHNLESLVSGAIRAGKIKAMQKMEGGKMVDFLVRPDLDLTKPTEVTQ